MKKSIVLAILGIAAGTTASYGQGTVSFNNYFSSTSPTINYSSNAGLVPAGKAGLAVGSEFDVELAWAVGTVGSTSALTFLPGTLTTFGNAQPTYPASDGNLLPNTYGAGWFEGPNVTLAGSGTAGSIVTLDVFCFNNGSLAGSTINGSSGLFQVAVGGGALPPASLNGTVGQSFTVANSVPEPTTMALGGLGLAALMLFRRKQV